MEQDVIQLYHRLKAWGGDDFWSSTRALACWHALSLPWPTPTLELGGQDGKLSSLFGREIELMVDIAPASRIIEGVYKQVRTGNAEALDLPDESFNSIVALDMVYHTDRRQFLKECRRVLRPGGILVLTDCSGYGDFLTWPHLLRQRGLGKEAEEWQEKEYQLHRVNIVPKRWWWTTPGFEPMSRQDFASLPLCRQTRAYQTVNGLQESLGTPDVPGIMQEAKELNRGVDVVGMLQRDSALCESDGAGFLFLGLMKR